MITNEIELVSSILKDLRELRDERDVGEIRSSYNIVCDRLDVLVSRLSQEKEKIDNLQEA